MEQKLIAFSGLIRQITSRSINALSHTQNEIQVIHLELGELRTGFHAMKTDLHHYQQKEKASKQTPIVKTENTVGERYFELVLTFFIGHSMSRFH